MSLRRPLYLLLFCALAISCEEEKSRPATLLDGVKKLCSDQLQAEEQALISAGRAIVTKTVVDLCAKPPCLLGPIVDQALLGDVVQVLPGQLPSCVTNLNAFLQIETASGYRGFIDIGALSPLPPGQPVYSDGATMVRVNERLASLYAKPDVTSAKPLWQIPLGISLRVVGTVDERWLKVELPGGAGGYMQRGDVTPVAGTPPPPSVACVLTHAKKYAGTPYLWGGRSTLGIDCSGLVSNAFAACGIVPPRDASPQFGWTKLLPLPKEPAQLQPGDLLFFGEKKPDGSQKVSHVGIFIGDGRFIHATTHEHPVVQDSALAEPHWTERWIGARRYPFN